MRGSTAPGRCADCGSDAYIQLAVEDAMLCAHCYADRLGLAKIAKPSPLPKPAIRRQAS
jgi:hypothetical protein